MAAESLSILQICNMALTQVGEPTITSLAEESKPARLCDLRFTDVLHSVLRAHPWNCATKRADLARLTTDPAFGFTYQYQLPTDFLRLVKTEISDSEHRIEGRLILSNHKTMKIKYIYRVTDMTEIDSLLQSAVAARLAAELCLPLARSAERQKNLWEQYKEKLSEARFIDSAEHPNDHLETDHWMDSRLGFSNDPFRSISSSGS